MTTPTKLKIMHETLMKSIINYILFVALLCWIILNDMHVLDSHNHTRQDLTTNPKTGIVTDRQGNLTIPLSVPSIVLLF